ncbi:MAG: SET domain-containing protein-lysine N-methyltransferase [Ilumatobacteraceae bacterium]|nr:SET domain-containing protein-lysine N-methyltransferase [Ilumatobacteraceae bacterium]
MAYLCHLLTPCAIARLHDSNKLGVFAIDPIRAGTLIAVFGGSICSSDAIKPLPSVVLSDCLQIEQDLFLQRQTHPEPAHLVNHSCDPNCGFRNAVQIVAMRDIPAGQEITYDAAMATASGQKGFICSCGSIYCRREITDNDWRTRDLQDRYREYFSPFIARRIIASRLVRRLKKIEAKTLLRNYDADPVLAMTLALRVVLGMPFCGWSDLILALPIDVSRQHQLLTKDPRHLDQLVQELNELRGSNFIVH